MIQRLPGRTRFTVHTAIHQEEPQPAEPNPHLGPVQAHHEPRCGSRPLAGSRGPASPPAAPTGSGQQPQQAPPPEAQPAQPQEDQRGS